MLEIHAEKHVYGLKVGVGKVAFVSLRGSCAFFLSWGGGGIKTTTPPPQWQLFLVGSYPEESLQFQVYQIRKKKQNSFDWHGQHR